MVVAAGLAFGAEVVPLSSPANGAQEKLNPPEADRGVVSPTQIDWSRPAFALGKLLIETVTTSLAKQLFASVTITVY